MLSLSISTRDAEYYISDGNTVLLVENILFKVRVRNPVLRLSDELLTWRRQPGPSIHADQGQVHFRHDVFSALRLLFRIKHDRRTGRGE